MNYRHPGYSGAPDDYDIPEMPSHHVASAPANVPLRTVAPAPRVAHLQDKDYWKKQMDLPGRAVGQSLANANFKGRIK